MKQVLPKSVTFGEGGCMKMSDESEDSFNPVHLSDSVDFNFFKWHGCALP